MPDDNDIRPIESDEVYTYDLVTAQQQERARTAASEYRVNGFKNRTTSRIGQMPANVRSKLKDISQFQ